MQDTLERPPEAQLIERAYRALTGHSAVQHLKNARAELIRARPQLAENIMHLQIADSETARKVCEKFPKTVFVTDGEDLAYSAEWVTSLTKGELMFVWAQIAYKYDQGWGADLRLSGRFAHWYALAMDAIANAWLVREGIGVMPEKAVVYPEITANTDTNDAYHIVRTLFELAACKTDELGVQHLDYNEVLASQEELTDGNAPMVLNGVNGLIELAHAA